MEALFEHQPIVKIIQKYLSLRDILMFMCTCKLYYSREWEEKMKDALCLQKRVIERWPDRFCFERYLDDEHSMCELVRVIIKESLREVRKDDWFECWIARCKEKFHEGVDLANRKYFPHATCMSCAKDTPFCKQFLLGDPRDFIAMELSKLGVDLHSRDGQELLRGDRHSVFNRICECGGGCINLSEHDLALSFDLWDIKYLTSHVYAMTVQFISGIPRKKLRIE